MSSEGPSKILTPRRLTALPQLQMPWLLPNFRNSTLALHVLLRKGFAVEPLDDRDCVAQGTDQTLRGRRRNCLKVSCHCCNLSMTNKSQTSATGSLGRHCRTRLLSVALSAWRGATSETIVSALMVIAIRELTTISSTYDARVFLSAEYYEK